VRVEGDKEDEEIFAHAGYLAEQVEESRERRHVAEVGESEGEY
jgi:hypothetical protein